jgi:membrane protease YdiL (CAAX protease family)
MATLGKVDKRPEPQLSAADWLVLVVSLVLPTAVTWLYFIALDSAPALQQQSAYSIGKTIQFALPVVWVFGFQRRREGTSREKMRLFSRPLYAIVGALFGLVIAAAMIALYVLALKPAGLFDEAASAVREKVQSFGAGSAGRFILLGVFYSALHSLLEEYYWRWFVFGQSARGCKLPAAIAISSIGFAAHHVLVLAHYFTLLSPLTWLFTLAIVIGGAFWAWLYRASGSLVPSWLSHALVDAAIFAIGYQMIAA